MRLPRVVTAPLRSAAICVAPLLASATAAAQNCPNEPPLKLHVAIPGSEVPFPSFTAGERIGNIFRAPFQYYPIEILGLRFGWYAAGGGGAVTQEAAIHIFGDALPNPGSPQFTLPSPVLTEGVVNEFDISSLPGNKIIDEGAFIVALEFANDQGPSDPAPAHDGGGCIPGRSAAFEIPGGWSDICDLGIAGQWIVEVIYRPLPRPLCASPYKIFLPSGGIQTFTLLAGPENAGQLYWIFGSATGTVPGFPLPPFTLPLNVDAYFLFTISHPNLLISNQLGFLDAIGEATAVLSLPFGTDPGLAGGVLNHAYIVYDVIAEETLMVSNAMPVKLLLP